MLAWSNMQGIYEAKQDNFLPGQFHKSLSVNIRIEWATYAYIWPHNMLIDVGGASLHLCMTPHGPDAVRCCIIVDPYVFKFRPSHW